MSEYQYYEFQAIDRPLDTVGQAADSRQAAAACFRALTVAG
jgi:hypothetical protein